MVVINSIVMSDITNKNTSFDKIITPDEAYSNSEEMAEAIRSINKAIQSGERTISIKGNLPPDFKQRLTTYVENHGWYFTDFDPEASSPLSMNTNHDESENLFYLKERPHTFPESWRKKFPWLSSY